MRRRWLSAAAAALAGAGEWLALSRQGASPTPGPAPVPAGATVLQTLPDADGRPRVWRLERHEVAREALDERVLPAPDLRAPRAAPRERD